MKLSFRIKHHFFSVFREIFVHHHDSLEFRAKIFALIIVEGKALQFYKDNKDRTNLFKLSKI